MSNELAILKAKLAKAEAEKEALQRQLEAAPKAKALSVSMSEKGCVSVYGLNARFPVSLYAGQWERLIQFVPEIQAFIQANQAELTRRGEITKAARAVG